MTFIEPSDKEDAAARAGDRVAARDAKLMAENAASLGRKQEALAASDQRIAFWAFIILLGWSSYTYGPIGFLGLAAFGVALGSYSIWKKEREPGVRAFEAVPCATQYVRLRILLELSKKSNLKWTSSAENNFSTKQVVTFEPPDGFNENFWPEVERVLPDFERLSPYERQKRLNQQIKELGEPLDEAEQFAKKNGIELGYWLQALRPRKKEDKKS